MMLKRILVPLDGHEAGEAVVPIVAAMAADTGASVRLLRVAPVPQMVVAAYGRTVAYVDQEMARITARDLQDLARVEARFVGIPVESVVRFGDPAEEILLEAEAFDADLIVLAAPRQGRLRALLAPGVADQVARRAVVPALVLRG